MLIRLDDKIWYYRNTPTPLPKILVCSHRYLLDEAGDLRGRESWECHARSRLCLLENSQCSDERHEHWPQSAPEVQLQSRSQALPWSFLKQEAQMCIKDENAIPPLSASLLICLTEQKPHQTTFFYREQAEKAIPRTAELEGQSQNSFKESFVTYFVTSFQKPPWKNLFYTSCMMDTAEIKSHKGITQKPFISRNKAELQFKC